MDEIVSITSSLLGTLSLLAKNKEIIFSSNTLIMSKIILEASLIIVFWWLSSTKVTASRLGQSMEPNEGHRPRTASLKFLLKYYSNSSSTQASKFVFFGVIYWYRRKEKKARRLLFCDLPNRARRRLKPFFIAQSSTINNGNMAKANALCVVVEKKKIKNFWLQLNSVITNWVVNEHSDRIFNSKWSF